MGSSCTRGIADNVREELWGYFALSGLLFLNIGIVLVVYALKRATPYPFALEVFGLGLIVMGVLTTLASWYVHRQHRRRKPLCAFACFQTPHERAYEASRTAFENRLRQNKSFVKTVTFSEDDKTKTVKAIPENTIKMFSTPEFQIYAEYMKRDSSGVEVNGAHKFKVESLRHKKHVHPQSPTGTTQSALLVNTVYTKKR